MNVWDWVIVGYIVVVSAAYLVTGSAAAQSRGAGRWARRHRLPETPSVIAQVVRGRAARGRALGGGALAVSAPALAALLISPPDLSPLARAFVLIGAAATGSWLALAMYAFRLAARQPTDPVRVAHATAPQRRSFARPSMVACLRATTAVAVAAGVAAGTVTGSSTAWIAAAALATGWLTTELAVGRLVHAPQHAGDPLALQVDDALRGQIVRDLYALPAVLAIIAAALAADAALTADSPPAGWFAVALLAVSVTVAVAGAAMAFWVELPAGPAGRRDAFETATGSAN